MVLVEQPLVTATFCATLVDEFVRCGITDAVVCPGSRSTPLALALLGEDRIRTHVVLDERSAGFVALGIGAASGVPALVLTTSGTAAVELHPAVVEADLGRVPLIVCSADRPPELHGVGAPQTVDQQRLFGTSVRSFVDPGPPEPATASTWRSLAARVVADACGTPPGPVQLNLPFREPLVGAVGELPPGRADGRPWHRRVVGAPTPTSQEVDDLVAAWADGPALRRGVVVAGAGLGSDDIAAILDLATTLGWPVFADPRSGARSTSEVVVAHVDGLLRVPSFAEDRPGVVLRFGPPPASKVLGTWLATGDALRISVDPAGTWWDPDHVLDVVLAADPAGVATAFAAAVRRRSLTAPVGWLDRWRAADDRAATAIAATLAGADADGEPGVARAVWAAAAADDVLVVSSSMPVRDLEWYAPRRPQPPRVVANRGANGIDGVVSTAVGVALATPATTWLLIGDLASLHDATGLQQAARRAVRLRIVVLDNDGGGIFSFLPQRSSVDGAVFEQLFGTPHGIDLTAFLAVHGVEVVAHRGDVAASIAALLASDAPVAALVVPSDRDGNVALHERIHAAVAAAVAAG